MRRGTIFWMAAVIALTAAAPARAAVVVSIASPAPLVYTGTGSTYVNVPVDLSLTSPNTLQALTLTFTYNSSLLSLASSNVTVGSIGSNWAPTVTAGPGYLIVSEDSPSYVSAPLSTSILNLDFLVNQGASGSAAIGFPSPYTLPDKLYDADGNNLTVTQSATTTFVNGVINATSVPASIWVSTVSGSWSTASNWSNGSVNSVGELAVFSGSQASNVTATLDVPQVAGGLLFGNSSGTATDYQITPGISGSGALTLNNSGSAIPLDVSDGTQSITAPITLDGNLTISETKGSLLTISGDIGQTSTAGLNLSGSGRLILSGSNDYTGGTDVEGGTLVLASAAALPPGSALTVGNANAFSGIEAADASGAPVEFHDSVSAVPEPGSLVLTVTGLLIAGLAVRGSRSKRADRALA